MNALQQIELDCDGGTCVVVGVARDGARIDLSPPLTRFVARDHAAGKAEFYGCRVVNPEIIDPTPIRVQRWGK